MASDENIAPQSIIIPTLTSANQIATNPGNIVLSGAKLAFFDGTDWVEVTSTP